VATVGESHIVLDRHWKDHFHRIQQQNPGVTVTVERLKRWIDEPSAMGLDDKVANFVIAAYVLMDNRILVLAGQTLEPDMQRLEPTTEVRTQKLPSEKEWADARPHAQAIFGVDASPLRNAANVSRLIDAVKEVANTHVDPARKLVAELDKAASDVGVDANADRLLTARAVRDLIERVLAADDVDAVVVLGDVEPPTSAAAMGRSMKSAQQVMGAVQRARWDVFASIAELPGKWEEEGVRIRTTVRDALNHDELSKALAPVLDAEDRKATQLLLRATKGGEKPKPPQPSPGPSKAPGRDLPSQGHQEGLSREKATQILEQLFEHRDRLEELSVRWRLRD
jgi:hypothetical protein